MQNFTPEKWGDKIDLFLDKFGFLRWFLWQWTIAPPSLRSHHAMLHSKTIYSSQTGASKLFCISFPLFCSQSRNWGNFETVIPIPSSLKNSLTGGAAPTRGRVSPGKIYSGTNPAVLLAPSKTEDTPSPSSPLAWHALTLRERWHLIRVELLYARLKYKLATLWLLNVEEIFSAPPPYHLPIKVFWTNLLPTHRNSSPFTLLQAYFWLYPSL